jgi:hypothetical protein
MTVEELRVYIYAIANKDQTGNLPTPAEFNSYLARANEDKFRIEYGLRENLQNNIAYQNSQDSTDALAPFLTQAPLTTLVPGQFALPADYVHVSSIAYIDNARRNMVMIVNEDEYNGLINNPIIPPTTKYPIAKFMGSSIFVQPGVTAIDMVYLRMPRTPVWGYTTVNDEPVYNPATSVQLEWKPIYHIDIARLVMGYMSIEFRDQEFEQYAIKTQTTGQ